MPNISLGLTIGATVAPAAPAAAAPTIESATANIDFDASRIDVTFSEPVQSSNFATGVTIVLDGATQIIDNVDLVGQTAQYTITGTIPGSDSVVTLSYSKAAGDIRNMSDVELEDVAAMPVLISGGA